LSRDIIVAKFGGSSMADAAAISQSAKVAVLNRASLIVVSATAGTTDSLIGLADALVAHDLAKAESIMLEVAGKHQKIAGDIGISKELTVELDGMLEELRAVIRQPAASHDHKKTRDKILGFGELLSSALMIGALAQQSVAAELVDARDIIKIDRQFGHAVPLLKDIAAQAREVLLPKLKPDKVLVTQGYIGSSRDGEAATLGRGGSDYSAALLAEAVNAGQLQIWTDVPGIASSDPKIVKNAKPIKQLSFQEAAELAIAGARVLYPRTITPLRRANVPLYVGNTFRPEAGGTTIAGGIDHPPLVRAIALKTNQYLLTLTTPEMASQFGYLAAIFNIFAKFKVSVDQISTSEIAVAVVLEEHVLPDARLLDELKELGEVSIEKGLSVVSLIGNEVNNTPGLAQSIFANLEDGGEISVRMICQGASRHNFCFLVADKHGMSAVQRLHKAFIEQES
jgi:aspartate kinase